MLFPGIKTYHRASRDALFEYRQTVEMPGILAVQYRRLLELRRIEGSIYVYDEVDFPGTALLVAEIEERRVLSSSGLAFDDFGETPGLEEMSCHCAVRQCFG